jgi:hypothetical protein
MMETDSECYCYNCNKDRVIPFGNHNILYVMTVMILCPIYN